MTINIIQTVTNILNEDRSIKSSSTVEAYLLIPAEGRALKNIKTGEIIKTKLCLNKKVKLQDYIEVDMPNTPK